MVERYYDRPSGQAAAVPFRCEGFLRDGVIAGADGGTVPLAHLPPFLRSLLVTDGTVTKILEAYFWEPVLVDTLAQGVVTAEREDTCLSAESLTHTWSG